MLGGIGEFGLDDRFCTHFLLPIEDGNHDVPEHLAPFVHSPCCMVRKRLDRAIELDDIGFAINGSFICGYPQFRMAWLRCVQVVGVRFGTVVNRFVRANLLRDQCADIEW